MYLGNPSLPISIERAKAKELAENALKASNWKNASAEAVKIVFVPYYFFEYATYLEKEQNGEKIVCKVERGALVLDPETSEIVEGIAESLPTEEEMLHEIPEALEFELRKPKLMEKDAEKICHLKAAETLGKPLGKVNVMNVRLFYVPLWDANATIDGNKLHLHVSAVDGNILEKKSIPYREKTTTEIAREALEELRDPKAWLKYTSELIQIAAKSIAARRKGGILNVIMNNRLWAIIIALIIILLIVVFLP